MKQKKQLLTEVELELMNILWKLEKGSVRNILEHKSMKRDLAYTSAATIMRILEQKKFTKSSKVGNTFYYHATLSKEDYQARHLNNISEKLFDNTPLSMVARLIDDGQLSKKDIKELKDTLNNIQK